MSLVHLHRHGDFSLLDGIGRDEDYAKRAAELGQSALALTDHGNLAGVLYHAEACYNVGIKPIIGMEAYFRPDVKKDRDEKNVFGYYHLVLLAKNDEGFKNLMRLSSLSYTKDYFYQKPCIDWRLLRENSGGLIATSSCVAGYIPNMLLQGDSEGALTILRVFQDIFGDDFVLETQPHDFSEQKQINIALLNMAQQEGIPVVATSDVHYPHKEWADSQMIFKLIRTQSSLSKMKEEESEKDFVSLLETLWLMSEDELRGLFLKYHSDIPSSNIDEMISNTQVISDRIEDFKYDKSPKIPKATKSEAEAESILRSWCAEGLARIGKQNDSVYLDRLEHELEVIKKLGVMDYFVIVGDMVRWAKDQGIRVGPGRGSAAGCLVNYLSRITAIDPIGYGLLFERFLNEYRPELPDIDIDFQDDRRDEVKEYLREKWGDDYVVSVAAFQSFGHKGVIKDVGRVLDIPYMEIERVTREIPQATKLFGKDMVDLREMVPPVDALFNKYPELWKHCVRLYGQMKGASKHAGAVIVTDRPAIELIPMMRDKEEGMVTQWSERANAQLISPYGFLKIDCLATNDLTNQDKTVKLIKKRHGITIDFEDHKQFPVITSPYEVEEDVIEAFADGANIGVFQFESSGIVGLLKQIEPKNLEHVIAANALYRPGTLENKVAFEYAKRKNNRINWKLPHPSLDKYIGYTFGFMIFQEQVMQIYSALAKDATDAEAGVFMKVVSKGVARDIDGKKKMQQYYDKYEEGCIEKGIPKKAYDVLWEQILQMSTYSFNKAHSSGYGLQGYQDKYLKIRYPLEFYASLMSIEADKIPEIIRESRAFSINVLGPDINISDEEFTVDGNSIRFGLSGIKWVGPTSIEEIKNKRTFNSFHEFAERVRKNKVNKRVKNALVQSGAFDSLGGRDKWTYDPDTEELISGGYTVEERAELEKETLGFTLSREGNDISKYKDIIDERITFEQELEDGEEALVAGEILKIKEVKTKNGQNMAFVDLDYFNTNYSITIFPRTYGKYSHLLVEGAILLAIGDYDDERQTIVAEHICTADQLATELGVEYASK